MEKKNKNKNWREPSTAADFGGGALSTKKWEKAPNGASSPPGVPL